MPADHNQFGLRVASRQSNPAPTDVDDTVVELVDVSSGRVLWRGTIARLNGVMQGDKKAWTTADLKSVRDMVADRRIQGLYVDGSSILRRAKNPSSCRVENPNRDAEKWVVVSSDDPDPISFYDYAEDALDGIDGDDTRTILRMMSERGFPKESPVKIPMQGCSGDSYIEVYRSRADLRADNPSSDRAVDPIDDRDEIVAERLARGG